MDIRVNNETFNLGKLRHDLRTPINQIVGYCELLIEDLDLSDNYKRDLETVKAGGWQLLATLNNYLSDQNFIHRTFKIAQLQQDLRTPVDHIIGFTEILMEIAQEDNRPEVLSDLARIHQAATLWLQMMETHLLPWIAEKEGEAPPRHTKKVPASGVASNLPTPVAVLLNEKVGQGERILIAEDDSLNRDILVRRVQRYGYFAETACDGVEAWTKLQSQAFDLVILDLVMPQMEGYEVLRLMRSDTRFSLIPVLMISGVDQDSSIVRCIEAGADDYLTKPFNPVFLKARIATCLEKKRLRDQERRIHAALVESQRQLASELQEAGRYVSCLLPPPFNSNGIRVDWHYQSCSQLGGDGFGYRWIDEDHWCFFLFDVCGHGVGAALLSISVLNVMRTISLPHADFRSPKSVLEALNAAFPMESNNEQYFTIWYGVFTPRDRRLTFGSAGHPAVLSLHEGKVLQLRTQAPPIGCIENAKFREDSCILENASHLVLLSDGVYEIERADGSTATLDDFARWASSEQDRLSVRSAWEWAQRTSIRPKLDDDFSILDLRFS